MSKKTIRSKLVPRLGAVAGFATFWLAGCATKSDGDGSESHFLCMADSDCASHGDGYRCVERECTNAASLEAGAGACRDETRGTPYTPGVVFTGAAGITVTLTSDPAPPSVGDNTWTFELRDAGDVPLDGATITAQQNNVDHGHGGSKAIRFTDLGGGSYQAAPVNFNMPGYSTLHIQKAPIDDKVVIALCVQ
jgi:hypothetical protein